MHSLQLLVLSAIHLAVSALPQLAERQSTTSITVNIKQTYQTIDGFGFSEAFQRANLIVNLPADKQKALIDLLFNTTTGVGFTIVRNGIGSSPPTSGRWR